MTTSTNPRVIFIDHKENGTYVNALSVTLQDPTGSFGIRESISGTIIVPPGTPVSKIGTGQYEYDIDSLNIAISYEFYFKVITQAGAVQYVYGVIPVVETTSSVDGIPIPPELIGTGTPVDIDGNGTIDGYAYDIYGDGYSRGFDLTNSGVITALDVGTVQSGSSDLFDARGVRIGLGANASGASSIINPTPDGKPDVPAPKGSAARDGTFGGTFGYDGTSGFVPATGGQRTNRSKEGAGYWEGVSFGNLCNIPIGPRGQFFKDKAHAYVRTLLRDTDTNCPAFTDDEIDMYLEGSLWAFNAQPTFTAFLWDHMQDRWLDVIGKGAVVWALYSQSLIESGREFTINDNGISYTPPPVSDKMQNYASTLLTHYTETLKEIKFNFKPLPAAVGVFSVLDISPSLRRLRHLREKRIF